jgi:hypothetical protein
MCRLAKIASSFWLLSGCVHHGLPHRDPAELFPQAVSPAADCPNQHPYRVDNPDGSGTFFLYCFGKMYEL